ncbi:MAG: hypothetical protein ACKPFA_01765, partial [Dolichospermum sp.]
KTKAEIFPFAYINQQVLRQLGGDYAKLAEQLHPVKKDQVSVNEHEPPTSVEITNLPEIKTFEFEFATITITEIKLQPFDFEVAKIEFKKSGRFKQKTELNINKQKKLSTSAITCTSGSQLRAAKCASPWRAVASHLCNTKAPLQKVSPGEPIFAFLQAVRDDIDALADVASEEGSDARKHQAHLEDRLQSWQQAMLTTTGLFV